MENMYSEIVFHLLFFLMVEEISFLGAMATSINKHSGQFLGQSLLNEASEKSNNLNTLELN